MWLFTKFGFFSVVIDQKNKDVYKVRARKRNDLEQLKFGIRSLSKCTVHEDKRADYHFRIFVNKGQLKEIMDVLSDTLDYPNFKDMISESDNQNDKLDSYHQVWEVMYEYQEMVTK